MGAALRRRRRLAGSALLGRRRLRFQAQDQLPMASSRSMSIRAMAAGKQRRSASIRSRSRTAFSRSSPAAPRRDLKSVLFNNEYISGILTTQGRFSQKYGYFEIRAKIPVGVGVWPAFWMLADDGGWPPEVDIMEGRGRAAGRRR